MTNFGQFIKTEREKQGLTQTEFGAMIGINSSAINRIENGIQPFSKENLENYQSCFKNVSSKRGKLKISRYE